MVTSHIAAALFDLDGLLIDSEPLWQRAEIEILGGVGVPLTVEACAETTGLRIDAVVAHWHVRFPWSRPSAAATAEAIVDRMVELVGSEGVAKEGAAEAVAACARRGYRMAVATSSPLRLLDAALERLGLGAAFEVLASAEREAFGKPHPAVFLSAARRLGVSGTACLVLEDSLAGVIAAKAARATCVAVPEPLHAADPRFVLADRILGSLRELDGVLGELEGA